MLKKKFNSLERKTKQLDRVVKKKLCKLDINDGDSKESFDHFVNGYISPIIAEISGISLRILYGIDTNLGDDQIKELEERFNNKINFLFAANKLKGDENFINSIKLSFDENPSQIKSSFQDAVNNSLNKKDNNSGI